MPEGPEVRRHADALARVLVGRPLRRVEARTKAARAWLADHGDALVGRRVTDVTSHGKHLVGRIEARSDAGDPFGGAAPYFHSHLMMWGRWHVTGEAGAADTDDGDVAGAYAATALDAPPMTDRRDRAVLESDRGVALLRSAPVFTVGVGDPYATEPLLGTLGPDALPVEGPEAFDAIEARHRLAARPERAVGAVLLDQQAVAGLGNYLRAEILYLCRIDPFRAVGSLTEAEWMCLLDAIPDITARAYRTGGVTLTDADVARMAADDALVYTPGRPWQRRHYVFRRTNLPCLHCATPVRQQRQVTREAAEGEEEGANVERIVYFCPVCQSVDVPERKRPSRRAASASAS